MHSVPTDSSHKTMKTITFTHTFTFPEQSVLGFAKFLGYVESSETPRFDSNGTFIETTITPNAESPVDYVSRLSKEHSLTFVTKWANWLAEKELEKQIDIIKPQIDEALVKPVEQALAVTYEVNG